MSDNDSPDLPESLETVEDYDKACQNFVLPFLHKQAGQIADVIVDLHKAIDGGKIEQEEVDFYINQIKELASFATDSNPMFAYFEQVITLEQKLDSQGLLHEEEQS